jgi:hypothetical protein
VVDRNGILVTPGDSEQIWNAMKRYIDDPAIIESEGNASRRNVETYLPQHVMNHLKEIYLKMLDVNE